MYKKLNELGNVQHFSKYKNLDFATFLPEHPDPASPPPTNFLIPSFFSGISSLVSSREQAIWKSLQASKSVYKNCIFMIIISLPLS